jgi:very-short-patch-repair endonuclease
VDLRAFESAALANHGILTLRRARKGGMSSSSWYRSIERGQLELIHPGVARLIGTPRSRLQRIAAAVLGAGSGALASHRSAAFLHGMPRPEDDPVDIILPTRTRRADLVGVLTHRPRDQRDLAPVRRHNIATVVIVRWLCDLGAVDPPSVDPAVGHVLFAELATARDIAAAIAVHSRRGRPGVPALRAAIANWTIDEKPVDSVLEPKMREALARARLPEAQFHAWIEGYEVDFWFPGTPVVLECDGWSTHGRNHAQFERDRRRDAELTAHGYITVRFTYRALTRRPDRVTEQIRAVLQRWSPEVLGLGANRRDS